jgi:ABC-type dipeptide/oligopeptide/nickel transport system permease subunit
MFRFTIRDLLWLMVVVAMGMAWWCDHRRLKRDAILSMAHQALIQEAKALHIEQQHRNPPFRSINRMRQANGVER